MKFTLINFFMFLFCVGASGQCIDTTIKKGEYCTNPKSVYVTAENNCSTEQYVIALCYDGNKKVYKLFSSFVKPGKKISNYTCDCSNVTLKSVNVSGDRNAAKKAAQEYIKECKAKNKIQ